MRKNQNKCFKNGPKNLCPSVLTDIDLVVNKRTYPVNTAPVGTSGPKSKIVFWFGSSKIFLFTYAENRKKIYQYVC